MQFGMYTTDLLFEITYLYMHRLLHKKRNPRFDSHVLYLMNFKPEVVHGNYFSCKYSFLYAGLSEIYTVYMLRCVEERKV